MKFLLDHDVPDDLVFALGALGHHVGKLREVLPTTAPDQEVLQLAAERDCVLITCNRDDFLQLSNRVQRAGIIILIRRRSRALERAALVRLLDNAGEGGIRGNINSRKQTRGPSNSPRGDGFNFRAISTTRLS